MLLHYSDRNLDKGMNVFKESVQERVSIYELGRCNDILTML